MQAATGWLPEETLSGPLAGMRVIDLSQQLPGPYATDLLGSLGADVIKVEPPAGDAARHLDPQMFESVNRHKRTMMLDLKSETERKRFAELLPHASVFVEGYRPGVAARLGCDVETVTAVQPRMIYCSISGLGQEGPLAKRPSHDISLQALTGAIPSDAVLDRIGVPWVDLGVATTAAFLIASHWRAGTGARLDLAMLDVAHAWATVKPEATQATEPTYGTLHTNDGEQVVIALLEDAMWVRMCQAFEWNDWLYDPALAEYRLRRTHALMIRTRLEATVANLTAQCIEQLSQQYDLPVEVIRPDSSEFKEQLRARGISAGEFSLPYPFSAS